MDKVLRCRDVGVDCDFVACGATEEEVFRKAGEHAQTAHHVTEISKEMMEKARAAMYDGVCVISDAEEMISEECSECYDECCDCVDECCC